MKNLLKDKSGTGVDLLINWIPATIIIIGIMTLFLLANVALFVENWGGFVHLEVSKGSNEEIIQRSNLYAFLDTPIESEGGETILGLLKKWDAETNDIEKERIRNVLLIQESIFISLRKVTGYCYYFYADRLDYEVKGRPFTDDELKQVFRIPRQNTQMIVKLQTQEKPIDFEISDTQIKGRFYLGEC